MQKIYITDEFVKFQFLLNVISNAMFFKNSDEINCNLNLNKQIKDMFAFNS